MKHFVWALTAFVCMNLAANAAPVNPCLTEIATDETNDIYTPYELKVGENRLPAAAGEYWYSIKIDDFIGHRYMMIDSDADIKGGKIEVWDSQTAYQPYYSSNNYIACRVPYELVQYYYVGITKPSTTASDETFTISFSNDVLAEDSVTTCPKVEPGNTYTTPHYNGLYYYAISTPDDLGTKFLVIDGGDAAQNSYVQVGTKEMYQSYVGKNSHGKLRCPVNAGQDYIITWRLKEGINDFPFTVSYEDIQEGEVESLPGWAVEGQSYTIPGESTRYYEYIATKECWIEATVSDPEAKVVFKKKGYSNITVASERTGNTTRLRAAEGESYIIVVTTDLNDCTLTVTEGTRGTGESASSAIEIKEGQTDLADEVHDIWYTYTTTNNGMLRVQSNIEFESDPMNPTRGSDVTVLIGSADATAQSILGYDADWNMVYDKEFAVTEDQTIYIRVKTYSVQEGKNIIVTERAYAPGESPLNPKELLLGENILPAVNSLTQPVWYAMDLEAGDFSITTENNQSFNFEMYTADNTTTPIAKTEKSGEIGSFVYALNYQVTATGRYLFRLTNAMEGLVVNVNGMTVGIHNTGVSSASAKAYDINGRRVNAPAHGLYILDGKKILK